MWRPLCDADLDNLQPVGNSWPTCDGEGTEEGTAHQLVPRSRFTFCFTRLPATPFPSFLTRYLTA